MWNKNRCIPYSRSVQITFPTKKHAAKLSRAPDVIGIPEGEDTSAVKGAKGFAEKRGKTNPDNCRRERRARYAVIGSHIVGITYQLARVKTYRVMEYLRRRMGRKNMSVNL